MPQPSIMDTGPHRKQVDNMWSLSLPHLAEQNSLQAWHDRIKSQMSISGQDSMDIPSPPLTLHKEVQYKGLPPCLSHVI